jgi:phosphohistidine phosphatase SixA
MLKTKSMRIFAAIVTLLFFSCTHTVYIVRHAEKATPMGNNTDVPLTEKGNIRATALKDSMAHKSIGYVLSTNTLRTRSTAQPTAEYYHLPVILYGNPLTSSLIDSLHHLKKNILIVGHSNTVDDIANRLCGDTVVSGDLQDREYNNIFVIKVRGKHAHFKRATYGPGN